jgi:uncharacterized protein (TIGR03086 family)
MRDIAATYGLVAAGFSPRVNAIAPDQWDAPTPHADWSVRQLVAHVISTQQRVLATLGGPKPGRVDENGELTELWHSASGSMSAALEDTAQATQIIRGLLGEQPFEELVGQLICADTLVHTWEFSRTLGMDHSLDPDAMRACMEFLNFVGETVSVG